MNCHDFEIQMEALLDGNLDPARRQACLDHAVDCPSCGELLTAVGSVTANLPESSSTQLVETVLEQTIGSACQRARETLPDFVDQELAPTDRELLDLHTESCTACRRLASTLALLRRELPRLAEAPLDDRFTAEVLAATLPRHHRLAQWWQSHWSGWVRRPRFAMEAAYVGLLVVMLVLGAFSTPVAALPQKGLELVQTDPETPSVWTEANEDLGTFWEWIASLFEKTENESTEDTP